MLRSYTVFFSAEYYAFLVCFAGEAFEFYYMALVFLMLEFPLKYVHRISQKTCLKINIDRLIKYVDLNRLQGLQNVSRNW